MDHNYDKNVFNPSVIKTYEAWGFNILEWFRP
jgi:hypothetical protein